MANKKIKQSTLGLVGIGVLFLLKSCGGAEQAKDTGEAERLKVRVELSSTMHGGGFRAEPSKPCYGWAD